MDCREAKVLTHVALIRAKVSPACVQRAAFVDGVRVGSLRGLPATSTLGPLG